MSEYFNAYYYGFKATDVPEVDAILAAVARAGKAYHHTEFWADKYDGVSQVDSIVEAAANCAESIAQKDKELSDLKAVLAQKDEALRGAKVIIESVADEDDCWYDHHGYCQAHYLQPMGECDVELAKAWMASLSAAPSEDKR